LLRAAKLFKLQILLKVITLDAEGNWDAKGDVAIVPLYEDAFS